MISTLPTTNGKELSTTFLISMAPVIELCSVAKICREAQKLHPSSFVRYEAICISS